MNKVRAAQHSVELDRRQKSKEDKIYTRAQLVLQELKPEGGSKLTLIDIKSRLSELNNCFSILFPGVTEAVHTKSTFSSDNNNIDIHQKIIANAPSANVHWECDGEEIDGEEEEGVAAGAITFPDNADEDDVAWEDESEKEVDTEEDDEAHIETLSAPYTIEINLPMTAAGIQNADNVIILQTIREITNHLNIHALPLLSDWRESLSAALGTYNQCCDHITPVAKRIRLSEELCAPIVDNTIRPKMEYKMMLCISAALAEVCAVDQEVQTLLSTRCRTLLGSEAALLLG